MATISVNPLWYASGLRWIAGLLETSADKLERTFGSHTPAANDLYFDSDIYLAEVRNRVYLERYY
jgi:hypothetical protein